MFRAHHCTLSVADLDRSAAFYAVFGFRPAVRWQADDASLQIAHLVLDGFILELFCYASNAHAATADGGIGNDLEIIGVKHVALSVRSLREARSHLVAHGIVAGSMTETTHGRTGIDYFFVRDPDGLWVEVVEDHRVITS